MNKLSERKKIAIIISLSLIACVVAFLIGTEAGTGLYHIIN